MFFQEVLEPPTHGDCTTPSHWQSLADFVADIHLQGIFAMRPKFHHLIRKKMYLRMPLQCLICNVISTPWPLIALASCFGCVSRKIRIKIWLQRFASEF